LSILPAIGNSKTKAKTENTSKMCSLTIRSFSLIRFVSL